eukprot:15332875-Ditylum_brightwellii.AAC.1
MKSYAKKWTDSVDNTATKKVLVNMKAKRLAYNLNDIVTNSSSNHASHDQNKCVENFGNKSVPADAQF